MGVKLKERERDERAGLGEWGEGGCMRGGEGERSRDRVRRGDYV